MEPFTQLQGLLESLKRRFRVSESSDQELQSLFAGLDRWVQDATQRKYCNDFVIDAALDAIVAINGTGKITEWNREAERMFGWSRSEAMGSQLSELIIPPRYREAHLKGLARFLESDTGPMLNRRTELTALRRDGEEFPIELTILEPIHVGDQIIVHGFARDITPRKQFESAIRASESLYHSLVDSLPIYVIRKDLDGKLTFVNRPYCELQGRDPEDLIGCTDYDFFPPELAEKYIEDDRQVACTGEVFHDVERNVLQGKSSYFEVWKVPVYDGSGNVVETQAIFWDVTERVETREALARERDLLRTLMDHLPDLIYVKDAQGQYVTDNLAHCHLLGLDDPSEVVGRKTHEFFDQQQANAFVKEDQEVMRTGKPILDQEQLLFTSAGRDLWYSCSKVPLRDREGNVLGIVGIDRDITARKQVEEDLRRSNRELDQFVSIVTHDLQAPLRGVSTYSRMLRDALPEDLNEEAQEYLTEVQEGLNRMQRLIDSLRSYARLTAKKRPNEPVDCNRVLQQALSNLDVEIREREASITFDPLPELIGDSVQLMQLFQNLLSNALKYCNDPPPRIHVSAEAEQNAWHFTVRDNGIGIPPEQTHDIFRIFQRLHDSEEDYSGTGIGLAVCKRIVDRHNGQIWVESTPDQGSTFHFTLSNKPDDWEENGAES